MSPLRGVEKRVGRAVPREAIREHIVSEQKYRKAHEYPTVLDPHDIRPYATLEQLGQGLRGFRGRGAQNATSALMLARRSSREDLAPAVNLPDDTRLWAALQQAGGGAWGGCVYDTDAILEQLAAGRRRPVA